MQLPTKLTALDRNFLSDWLNVMEPFVDISTTLQADRKVTSSLVMPAINSLKEHVNNFPTRYNSKFIGALKKSMQTRLNKYKEEQAYHCATFLDSRFKLEAFTSDKVRLEITDLVKTSTTTQLSEDTQDISQSPPRKRSRLFDFKRHSSLVAGTLRGL